MIALKADSKRVVDLDELGPSAGTGIYVLADVEGSMHGESVDVCTLTDESVDAWLSGLDEAALRRTCKVLLGRKP